MLKLLIILFTLTAYGQSLYASPFIEGVTYRHSLRSLHLILSPIKRSLHWVANDRKAFQQTPFNFQEKLCSILTNALKENLTVGNSFFKHNADLMNQLILKEKNGLLIPHKQVILGISPKETIEQHKMNGITSSLYHFNGTMTFDFPYVSLTSQNHNLVCDVLNKNNEFLYRSYVTPLIAALLYPTVGDFQKYNAVKNIWNSLSDCIFGYLKKGDKVEFLLSITAPQITTKEDVEKQARYFGVDPSQLTESLCGGGVQICVIRAPSHCYTLKLGKIIDGQYAGRNESNGLFEDPKNIAPGCVKNKTIRSHLLNPDEWRQKHLCTYDFFE